MTKPELIDAVVKASGLTKKDATTAVSATIEAITKSLKKGQSVSIIGFGTFEVRKRKARTGRNPQTGETLKIKAAKVPAFKPGKALKDAVAGAK